MRLLSPAFLALALWSSAAVLAGCGGAAAQMQVTSPFTEEHETAFENGVDFIDDPSILEGAYLTSWEDDIDRRVSLADAVALVTVTTYREDVDLDRRLTYHLITVVDRERHGSVPAELSLTVRQGERGFNSVRGNSARLLNQHFVLFLKWADDGGRVVARWHLSPATDRILRRVNSLIERTHTPEDDRRRVIVTDHRGHDGDDD